MTRTSIRVRTAISDQTRQGRYLGARPPYGYRLADARPHPNKAHAALGRRAHRLEPDPGTAHVVSWIFGPAAGGAFRGADHPGAERGGHPVPVGGRPGPEPAPYGRGVDAGHGHYHSGQPAVHRPSGNGQRPASARADPANTSLGHKSVQRWNLPDGWVISDRPAHPALVSEADFIAAQDISAARGPAPVIAPAAPGTRRYLLAGLLACGTCGRRMESAWSNGKAAYRCRHGHTSAAPPDPGRPKNAYISEDRILAHLRALHLLLTGTEPAPPAAPPPRSRHPASGRCRGCDRVPARPRDHPHLRPGRRNPAGRHLRSRKDRYQESRLTPGSQSPAPEGRRRKPPVARPRRERKHSRSEEHT